MTDMTLSPALCALLCFTALTLALALAYVSYRVALVLSFKAPANAWTREAASHADPAWVTRCHHAHLNCVENLPLFAVVVLVAAATGQLAVVDPLAMVFLGLRLAQSGVHVISIAPAFVFLRANLWLAQTGILAYWLLALCNML